VTKICLSEKKSKLCLSYFSLSKLMHPIESLLLSRFSVGSESEANVTQSDETDEEKEKTGEEEKNNGFRRKLAPKPPYCRSEGDTIRRDR
jgi:hypothetical protein